MKKVTLTVMALLFVAAIATTALAFGRGRGPGNDFCEGFDLRAFTKLNLTADQKAKLKEMREAQRTDVKPLQEQMWTQRDELRKLWLEPNPDQGKIAAANKEMRAVRDQMQDRMTALVLDSLKVLTPEQQEKLRSAGAGKGLFQRMGFGPRPDMGHGKWHGAGCFGGGPKACGNR
jgi:Spy/CpxP family protein refolding chaperone